MRIMINKHVSIVCFFLLMLSSSAYAGFFDDLKKKAEKAISNATKDVVEGVTGKSKSKDAVNPPASHEEDHKRSKSTINFNNNIPQKQPIKQPLTKVTSAQPLVGSNQIPRLDGNKAALLKVRFRPESFTVNDGGHPSITDHRLTEVVRNLYGFEYNKLRNDKAKLSQAMPKFRKRLLDDANQMPMTYRHVISIGKPYYDTYMKQNQDKKNKGITTFIRKTIGVNFNRSLLNQKQFIPLSPEQLKSLFPEQCQECIIWAELVYEIKGYPTSFPSSSSRSDIFSDSELIAEIKRWRFYAKGPGYGHKGPVVLNDLFHEVQAAELPPNQAYVNTYGGDPVALEPASDKSMKISF